MWSIEEERKQAQEFALRASMLQEMGLDGAAELFHDLVHLCDWKIALFKAVDERQAFIEFVKTNAQASTLGEIKPPGQT